MCADALADYRAALLYQSEGFGATRWQKMFFFPLKSCPPQDIVYVAGMDTHTHTPITLFTPATVLVSPFGTKFDSMSGFPWVA